MNRKNKISTGNFKNAISIKPDDMLNVRSFTIPTNYTSSRALMIKEMLLSNIIPSNTGH